ncbi:MAG TPA: ribosome maturation factor RimM [Candidatus Polarisedimenticolaceae bacterium]|nr:ribosome maturation factor RimM [Candidatus Polarisedimenticolaceae bacterium]
MSRTQPELLLGRVRSHRGARGELTVHVHGGGEAARWTQLGEVWIGEGEGAEGRRYVVEAARGYRDRLVLKLQGVDDASAAAGLRGRWVRVPEEQLPRLPQGTYFAARLRGFAVVDTGDRRLGIVRDIVGTGGTDLLVVEREATPGRELMIPMVDSIVLEIAEAEGRIRVRLPEGLEEAT